MYGRLMFSLRIFEIVVLLLMLCWIGISAGSVLRLRPIHNDNTFGFHGGTGNNEPIHIPKNTLHDFLDF